MYASLNYDLSLYTRNPNSEEDSEFEPWFPFTVPDLDYKIISLDLPNSRALKSKQCAFWNKYIGRVSTFTGKQTDVEYSKQIYRACQNANYVIANCNAFHAAGECGR